MRSIEFPPTVLARRAIVYVRQSTGVQVQENLESQRQQYALADLAREYGFAEVNVIDDDLGCSASGTVPRRGFQTMVGQICEGVIGAVFCSEASRLARNGRDWHHLLELCGMVGARVVDAEGVYDPSHPNDRLLLGLKGTMSEFELTVLRRRLIDAARAKARRGELRICTPIGYVWQKDEEPEIDPDRRVQEAIRTVLRLFDRLGSGRQVLLHMKREGLLFPRPLDPKRPEACASRWTTPGYRNIISVLQNPFYAGAYAYGKSEPRTTVVDGRLCRTYGHDRPMQDWAVLLREHHAGYISWEDYERNQQRLRRNAYRKPAGAAKSGRGGKALLSGLLRCARCGRMLQVVYSGRYTVARYACRVGHAMHGLEPCITFGALRPDGAVAHEIVAAVQPVAIEAAVTADSQVKERNGERRRALELERQQAEYEVNLAARRYQAVDPDNRLVAAELEARWNASLARLRDCESKLNDEVTIPRPELNRNLLIDLASDLEAAWIGADMRARQRLVRALIEEVVVDVDEAAREVLLVIHWRGGQHSELRVRKARSGEHTKRASANADGVIRDMAQKWSDEHIAATLNRMGLHTGQGQTWTARRVGSYRRKKNIHAYASAAKDGVYVTMYEAARVVGASSSAIRRLIEQSILPARQVMKDAPWQILAADLQRPEVQEALRRRRVLRRPCRGSDNDMNLRLPGT